jgi:hypothetical protein
VKTEELQVGLQITIGINQKLVILSPAQDDKMFYSIDGLESDCPGLNGIQHYCEIAGACAASGSLAWRRASSAFSFWPVA